ncbi:ankyrin repeat-containing domain protein [Mycena floridula]|nr:ankyrin repeat-containing domain protein [Mycena floridula]
MEAVGFVSSVITLAEAATTMFKYVKDIKDGPTDRAELQRSLAALPGLLAGLNAQFTSQALKDPWATETLKLAVTDGPFDQLLEILQKVKRKLDLAASRTEKVIQILKWPLDKAEITDLLQQVERVKSFIMLALQNDHIALSRAIHQCVQQMSTHVDHVKDKVTEIADGAKRIQAHNMNADLRAFSEWLSPIDFQAIQQKHLAKRVPGTGHWLTADVEFERWMAGQINILWCPGNPGVGKTILASIAVDHLRNQLSQAGVGVACIFFDYNSLGSQSITDIFGSLIRQLLIDSSSSPDSPNLLHSSFKSRQSRPISLSALVGALQVQIQLYSRVYLVVDALDEYSQDIRDDFISTIRSLTESEHLNVLITSRDISTIAQEFTNDARIDVRAHDEDVLSYISYRIKHEKRLKNIVKEDAVLKKEIVEQVTEKAAGMFLLVRLHLDSLASKNNRHALRRALTTLPKDIHRSYDDTMARIMAQGEDDANLACQIFLWLTYAKEQLTVQELQHALAISPGMTEINPDAITDIDILMSVCAGLVIIEEDHWNDQFPRFVHYTTQEYFTLESSQKYFRIKEMEAHFELKTTEAYFKLSGKPLASDLFAHFHIVATCVTHLAFEDLQPDFPLMRYSMEFWGYHAGQCENLLCSTPRMAALLQNHLEDGFKVPSPLLSRFQGFNRHYHSGRVLGSFGLSQLTSMLLDCGVPVNSKDPLQWTVLGHAVQNGHVDMVKWLLVAVNEIGLPRQQLFNINDADRDGSTLLHHSLKVKRPAIAEFLLGLPGINADVADVRGRTPLSYAAGSSYTQIADLLSRRADVNPNSRDLRSCTPLYYAVRRNHVETVRILLRLPNIYVGPLQLSPSWNWEDPYLPLKVAVEQGYVDIVDLLLKHPDIDPNWKVLGQTPLLCAIKRGNLEVVNLLLQHSAIQPSLMSASRDLLPSISPLRCAVLCGLQRIVERLLQHPDIDVNCSSYQGETPLLWAVSRGPVEVVEVLLQHPHIQPDIPDQMGKTPLMMAAMEGHESSFRLLFQSHKVTRDLVSSENVGLLAYAAYGGNQNIVHQVLDLTSSSGCKDCRLCTPLSYAVVEGYQDIVEFLLEKDNLQRQLEQAFTLWKSRPAVRHLLLPNQKNSSPSFRHRQHFTTLIHYALRWGYTRIAALLRRHVEMKDTLGVDSWK